MSVNLNSKQATTGITAVLVIAIIVVLNFLVGGLGFGNFRIDLTEDRIYTLSQGTKNILSRLNEDEPVTIRYYYTTDDRVMPNVLKPHVRAVEDLLLELVKASGDKIILETIHPNPNTEEEDKAREDEIQDMGPVNQEGDKIYLGLAIQCLDQKEVIPFLNPPAPNEGSAVEYDIARAISKVIKPAKNVVGVMSSIPVMGSPMYPFQKQRGQEPWVVVQQLRADYEVVEVPMGTDKIDSNIKVLLVLHPADIMESAEYAIDQFLLGGGKVIALVDPNSVVAQAFSGQQNPMTGQPGGQINTASDLKNLFKSWGIGFKNDMVVADMNYRGMLQGRNNPTALQLPAAAISREDRITSGLNSLTMVTSGSFSIDKRDGIDADTLVTSSEESAMIDIADAEKARSPQGLTTFNSGGRKQILAVRLTGKFKTAFPDGKPTKAPGKPDTGGAQDEAKPAPVTVTTPPVAVPAAAPTPATAPVAAPAAVPSAAPAPAAEKKEEPKKDDGSLKESANSEGVVILFADVDMLYDAFCVQQDPMTGMLVSRTGNLPAILNAVEVLSGGGDLLQVRNRKSAVRPFSTIKEMREKVESRFRPQLMALEAERQKTAEKMGSLRLKRDSKGKGFIVDPQQQKDLEALMQNDVDLSRKVRDIKKEQNKEIEYTKTMLKWLNFLAVPLLVSCAGILLAIRRRAVTAAV
ncbi:GldG family protein [Prosthecobacter sp.]|uniref:GldG family protein n=1 Tax=Prosthecobacter sp. TaxID=1965333 RepID=UPI002ABAFCC6|nr:GldG family protein [Prosthecobacter sp.]MDZ4401057.1 GldG family protein [Prosthecobacter sp.]